MPLKLRTQIHPFSSEYTDTVVEQQSIRSIFTNLQTNTKIEKAIIIVEDELIEGNFDRIPRDGSRVYIRIIPEGSDLKESGEISMWTGGLMFAAGLALTLTGVGATIGVALMSSGVSTLIGGIVMYNTDITADSRTTPEQDPSIRGSKNTERQYGSIPFLLGRHLINADIGAHTYTEIIDNDQWLVQLYSLGYNDHTIELDSLKVGDTALTELSSTKDINQILAGKDTRIKMEILTDGTESQLYPKVCREKQFNSVLKNLTDSDESGAVIMTTENKTTKINVDIFFLDGLGSYNDSGDIDSASVEVRAWYKADGADDSTYQLLGYFNSGSNVISAAELKTKRYQVTKTGLTAGKYTVKIERVTADTEDSDTVDTVYVGSVRAFTNDRPISASRQSKLSVIVLKTKASDVAKGVIDNFNCICQSHIPNYVGTGTGSAAWTKSLTKNPASLILYSLRGQVNCTPVADEDIDWPSFEKAWTFCESKKYYCNKYIAESYTISSLYTNIGLTGRISITKIDGKFSLVVDTYRETPVQLFTPRNTIDYQQTLLMPDVPDQIDYNFIDETSGYQNNTRPVYNTPTGELGKTPASRQETTVWGITDPEHVFKFARYQYAGSNNRQSIHKISCDIEYIMCQKGDLIEYAGDTALSGVAYGRVKSLIYQSSECVGLASDTKLPFEAGNEYGIRIRRRDGTIITLDIINNGGTTTNIYFENPVTVETIPSERDLFTFGVRGKITKELIVTDIQPGSDLTAELTCIDYAPEIFEVDDPDYIVPAFDSKLSTGGIIDTGFEPLTDWNDYVTYNDSDIEPARPTGSGDTDGWHTVLTINTKWQSRKKAREIFDGVWGPVYSSKGATGEQGEQGEPGIQGLQGVQGPAGANGVTTYTWIKYATSSAGAGMSDDPTGKTYIGFAYNKTTATESTNPADYTWSLIKGDTGAQGPQGVQGAAGANGVTTYTWIKYSDVADGTGLYDTPTENTRFIGIATNKTTATESTTKTDYTWSSFKGSLWFSGTLITGTSTTATIFSGSGIANAVVGDMYKNTDTGNTYKCTVSGAASVAKWVYDGNIKGATGAAGATGPQGAQGLQGAQGPAGANGVTTYTWIKYATSSAGAGMSDDPTGKTYIGFAYNKTTATESTNAADYTWSLIKGDTGAQGPQGVQGAAGANGVTTYTWIKYSDVADGTGLYDTPTDATRFIGIATNKTTATESKTKTDYTWSSFKGSLWFSGTLITGTSTTATIFSGSGIANAVAGDMYKNTSTGNTYKCTVSGAASVAKWVYDGNIKGATGDGSVYLGPISSVSNSFLINATKNDWMVWGTTDTSSVLSISSVFKRAHIYKKINNNSTACWQETTDSKYVMQSMQDVIDVTDSAEVSAIVLAKKIVTLESVIQELFAKIIKIEAGGKIYGGQVDIDNDVLMGKGFIIREDGQIESSDGVFRNCTIENANITGYLSSNNTTFQPIASLFATYETGNGLQIFDSENVGSLVRQGTGVYLLTFKVPPKIKYTSFTNGGMTQYKINMWAVAHCRANGSLHQPLFCTPSWALNPIDSFTRNTTDNTVIVPYVYLDVTDNNVDQFYDFSAAQIFIYTNNKGIAVDSYWTYKFSVTIRSVFTYIDEDNSSCSYRPARIDVSTYMTWVLTDITASNSSMNVTSTERYCSISQVGGKTLVSAVGKNPPWTKNASLSWRTDKSFSDGSLLSPTFRINCGTKVSSNIPFTVLGSTDLTTLRANKTLTKVLSVNGITVTNIQ